MVLDLEMIFFFFLGALSNLGFHLKDKESLFIYSFFCNSSKCELVLLSGTGMVVSVGR